LQSKLTRIKQVSLHADFQCYRGNQSYREYISSSHLPREGFGWDRVNFLCTGSYENVFWIFDENSGGNTAMLFVVAE